MWLKKLTRLAREKLATKVKNLAGTHFINMREVLVSEMPEQMAFVYMFNIFFVEAMAATHPQDWHKRTTVHLKYNNIKTCFFDHENTQIGFFNMPAQYYKFDDCFGKQGTPKKHYKRLVNIKPSCISTVNTLSGSLKLNATESYQNDWLPYLSKRITSLV